MHAEPGSLLAAVQEDVVVVDYDPCWPGAFERERERILAALPGAFVGIEHIGSTAVPGLPAKPIIDMLAGVDGLARVGSMIEPMRALGYAASTTFSNDITDHLWFMRWIEGRRTHQFHVVLHGDEQWVQRLRFRDALRSDVRVAREYANLKATLAAQFRADRRAYTAGKAAFVARHSDV